MTESHKSKYAAKKEAGNQMYGPGCCAHTVTASQIAQARARARISDPRLIRDALMPTEAQILWSDSESQS